VSEPCWVDTHGHLFLLEDEPSDVIERAVAAGVEWIVCPGIDEATSRQAAVIAADHPDRVLWSAGLHPHDASAWPEVFHAIGRMAGEASAVGECGLDWYRELSPRDHQIAAFRDQIEIASDLGKPIIVHCRDAFREVYDLVEEAGLGELAVLHCWTGGPKWTKRFDELGVTFSFAGPLTYPTADAIRRAAAVAPPDRTMIETDSPYLAPQSMRPADNEPAFLPETGEVLAEVWGMEPAEVARRTSRTAEQVFGSPRG
jgi:TatD DNase family protein